jgi:hypothetical protein
MKTADERLADTKSYLSNHITPAQYNEVMNLLGATPNKQAISDALSIGHANPLNTAGRRAKRAAMLLALLFIEDAGNRTLEVARIKTLGEGNEQALIAEIKSWFTLQGITPAMVATSAVTNIGRMAKWNNVNFDAANAVRGVYNAQQPFNCYNACVFWAFQAGAISKRYLWNKLQGKDGDQFFPTYSQIGWTNVIEFGPDGTVIKDDSRGGAVVLPAGMTVYFQTPAKVFGHVACSLGDGRVISQNSVFIGDKALNALPGAVKVEFEKMANAITHIVTVRDMVTQYFNPKNGYKTLQVSNGAFWDPIPANQR